MHKLILCLASVAMTALTCAGQPAFAQVLEPAPPGAECRTFLQGGQTFCRIGNRWVMQNQHPFMERIERELSESPAPESPAEESPTLETPAADGTAIETPDPATDAAAALSLAVPRPVDAPPPDAVTLQADPAISNPVTTTPDAKFVTPAPSAAAPPQDTPGAFAVGQDFPVYEQSMLLDLRRHDLPPVDGAWRYYVRDGIIYKVDAASHKVTEVVGRAKR